jgi:cation transporter-like permease
MSKARRQSIVFIIITTALASCISMIGGVGIEYVEADLFVIVPLVIALPALNTMVGDYATIIAAHAGSPGEGALSRRKLMLAVFKSTIVNIIGTVGLSLFIADKRGYETNFGFVLTFMAFVALSVGAIVTIMFVITYSLDRLLEKKKLNPDDVLIPVVTTITDVFMLGLIAIAAKVLF